MEGELIATTLRVSTYFSMFTLPFSLEIANTSRECSVHKVRIKWAETNAMTHGERLMAKVTGTGSVVHIQDFLRRLEEEGTMSREDLSRKLETSSQRLFGFVDSMEDFDLIAVNRNVRPYQIQISQTGRALLGHFSSASPSEVLKKGLSDLATDLKEEAMPPKK